MIYNTFGYDQKDRIDINIDDYIYVDFDYKIGSGRNNESYGNVCVYRNTSNYNELEYTYPVKEINQEVSNVYGACIVYNNKGEGNILVKDNDINNGHDNKFTNFAAIVATNIEGQENKFEVTRVINTDTKNDDGKRSDKTNIIIPENGIIIYFHDQDMKRFWGDSNKPGIVVGDEIEVDFNYKELKKGYNPDGFGNIKVYRKTNKSYEIHHINNLSKDEYAQKGPILIYNPENKNIKASEISSLTRNSLDGTENSDSYNFIVVIAKKYDEDTFYISRREYGYFTHGSASNNGENRKFEDLNIAVPEDGVVLLFPTNASVEIPNVNELIQFSFDYKGVTAETGAGASVESYGTWKKVHNAQKFTGGVEQGALDCYSVTEVNKLDSSNNIPKKGPIVIYNENNMQAKFNEIPSIQRMPDKNFNFRYAIATKYYDNKYRVSEVSTKKDSSLKSINSTVPKDSIALIWYRDSDDYGDHYEETKFPIVGDILEFDFDYKSTTTGTVYRYSYSGKERVTSDNGLKPITDEDLLPNESIIYDEDLIKINLYNYNEHINDKFFEESNQTGAGYLPFFSLQEFDLNTQNYAFQRMFLKDFYVNRNTDSFMGTQYGVAGLKNMVRESIAKKLPKSGYPELKETGKSIGYLFGEEHENIALSGVYENLSGLFIYDEETGQYRFDSREHCAQLSDDKTNLDLYNARLSPGILVKPFGNFMPFNDIRKATKPTDIDREYFEKIKENCYYQSSIRGISDIHKEQYLNMAKYLEDFISKVSKGIGKNDWNNKEFLNYSGIYYDTTVPYNTQDNFDSLYTIAFDDIKDYHFGINIEARFKTYKDNKLNGNDVIYKFDGDDDVFVYIDDVLFLDLGGTGIKGGEINFTTGKVSYFSSTGEGKMSTTPDYSKTFKQILKEAKAESDIVLTESGTLVEDTIHSIKFYCLERGSGVSLCSMNFNMNIVSQYTALEGKKEWRYADNPNSEPEDKPEKIRINLYRTIQGEDHEETKIVNSQEISAENDWKYRFERDSEGNRLTTEATMETVGGEKLFPCTYYIQEEYMEEYEKEGETKFSEKYVTEYVEDSRSTDYNKITNIINWYNYTDVTVTKEWDDNNNATNQRPKELKVVLSAKESEESKIADEIVNNKTWTITKKARLTNDEENATYASTNSAIPFPSGSSFTFRANDKYTFRYVIANKIENDKVYYEYDSGWKENISEQDFTAVMNSDKQLVFLFKKIDGTSLKRTDIEEIKKLIIYYNPNSRDLTDEIFTTEEQKDQLTQYLTEGADGKWIYRWIDLPRCIINEDGSITRIIYDIEEELKTEDNYYQLDKIKIETKGKLYNITIINSMYRDIQVTKIDSKDSSIKLEGAKFKLQKLKLDEKGEWSVDETVDAIISDETNNSGETIFKKLLPGKYLLSETKTPSGYNKSKEKITIDIVALESDNVVKVDFKNKKGFALPFTGGNTTLSYIIIGVAVMLLALDFMRPVLLLNRKNKRKPKRRKK